MNEIDIKNIQKELTKRKAANYEWEAGGKLSKNEIINYTNEELNKLVKDFENNIKSETANKIKKLVDEMFTKYGKENDNMIAVYAANYTDRCVCNQEPLENIDWNGFDNKYNKLYFPICSTWDCGNYWTRRNKQKDILEQWKAKWDKYYQDILILRNLFNEMNISSAKKYYDDHNDALNECWYGVIGIMKDYRIVAFVIRDDGMLCDEESYNTFYNKIICTL